MPKYVSRGQLFQGLTFRHCITLISFVVQVNTRELLTNGTICYKKAGEIKVNNEKEKREMQIKMNLQLLLLLLPIMIIITVNLLKQKQVESKVDSKVESTAEIFANG